MKIRVASLYIEPGISFRISYRVFKFIEKVLNESIHIDSPNQSKFTWISLIVGARTKYSHVEVEGPDKDRKNECIVWGLLLPFNTIINSNTMLETFIAQFFEAVSQALSYYDIPKEVITSAKKRVLDEVIGNENYVYCGEASPQPDLSDIKF